MYWRYGRGAYNDGGGWRSFRSDDSDGEEGTAQRHCGSRSLIEFPWWPAILYMRMVNKHFDASIVWLEAKNTGAATWDDDWGASNTPFRRQAVGKNLINLLWLRSAFFPPRFFFGDLATHREDLELEGSQRLLSVISWWTRIISELGVTIDAKIQVTFRVVFQEPSHVLRSCIALQWIKASFSICLDLGFQ